MRAMVTIRASLVEALFRSIPLEAMPLEGTGPARRARE